LRYTPIKEQEADKSLSKAADHNANVARWHKNVTGMTHTGAGKPKQTSSITESRQTAVNISKNDTVQAVQKTIPVTRLCQYGRVIDCIRHSGVSSDGMQRSAAVAAVPVRHKSGCKRFRSKHCSYHRYLTTLSTDKII
jgi:hypothetical protein